MILAGLLFCNGCKTETHSQKERHEESAGHKHGALQASVEWDKAFNAGNATNLALLYAEKATSMPPNAPTIQGRKALQADFESFFTANSARHETTVDEIVHEDDLAIERAHYRLTIKPKNGGAEVVETGRHLECRKKIDGRWQIVMEIWNLDTPMK